MIESAEILYNIDSTCLKDLSYYEKVYSTLTLSK